MVTLRTYLEGRPKAEFAAKVDIRPPYLSQLLSGQRKPSLALMLRIQEASEGEVDLNSWTLMAANAPSHGKDRAERKGSQVSHKDNARGCA